MARKKFKLQKQIEVQNYYQPYRNKNYKEYYKQMYIYKLDYLDQLLKRQSTEGNQNVTSKHASLT